MAGERTEQATQHRREQARKDGDILHSKELSAAAGTLAGAMVLGMIGSRTLLSWRSTFAAFLALGYPAHWEPSEIQPTLFALRRLSLSILAGVMVLGMIGSRTLLSWRSTFAAFLALGYPAHWEPSEIQPTLFALRR